MKLLKIFFDRILLCSILSILLLQSCNNLTDAESMDEKNISNGSNNGQFKSTKTDSVNMWKEKADEEEGDEPLGLNDQD